MEWYETSNIRLRNIMIENGMKHDAESSNRAIME